jgi:branched-chain amino acid aminotransferase
MSRVVSIDGSVVTAERAVVSVFDRGFLYGDGVFESMRVYGGRAFACGEHLARLARSARALDFEVPVDAHALEGEVARAIAASGLAEAYVRVMVTRGPSESVTLTPSGVATPTRVVIVEALRLPAKDVYTRGLRAVHVGWSRGQEGGPAAGAKVLSYVASLAALREARARGAEEAIFVARDGSVRDASAANVVAVTPNGALVSPADGAGVLGGITRGHVFDLACTMGLSCSLQTVTLEELRAAREVFLTSSIREIASVVSIDGRTVGDGAPGAVARALHRAYRMRAGATGAAPWE